MRQIIASILITILYSLATAQNNEEFRATWVITWEHISAAGTIEDKQARVRGILDNHKTANMNAVLWQVRQGGTAYYRSSFEPWGSYAGYQDPGYDHLAYAVEQAHARGLELHAWFNVFAASSTYPGTPAEQHPEWVCRDLNDNSMTSSRALSPGLEAVRDYTINVAMEIVRNYDIDGLHLDYVRWNEYYSTSSKNQTAPAALSDEPGIDGMISEVDIGNLGINQANRYLYDVDHPYSAGIPDSIPGTPFSSWENFWRWSVTEFVRVLHDSVQAVKPWVRLSPAALGKYNWSGWNGYNVVYQDAAFWYNQGYIDQLMMMSYHWLDAQGFYDMLVGNPDASWGPHIQPGVAEGRLVSIGPPSYRLSQNNIWSRHEQIVDRSRDVSWVDGFQFFSYGNWAAQKYWQESTERFFYNQSKVKAAGYLMQNTPDAPSLSGSQLDSLTYRLDVDPEASTAENHRFAIYRSEDAILDVDTDEIIDIHFGMTAYALDDSISGYQDFDGQYTYFATMLDRYWNESQISGSYLSEAIPSFAPSLLATTPQPDDTVNVNTTLTFTFTKTMDITSFENQVQISPEIEISDYIWSADRKRLSLVLGSSLEYETMYTVTVSAAVTDVNGRNLDGNGDGGASEDFTLEFITHAVDTFGPNLFSSHPSPGDTAGFFDIADIISVTFDELLDHATVDEQSVQIHEGASPVAADVEIFDFGNRSVVGLKASPTLEPARDYTITLSGGIADTIGNPIDSTITLILQTEPYIYTEEIMIDGFTGSSVWRRPGFSGSTNGVDDIQSTFGIVTDFYLPGATRPLDKKAGELHYVWDPAFLVPAGSDYLLREYCSALAEDQPNPAVNVHFDTTYTLQCYVFGDGSRNKFRFALDEGSGFAWPNHEVSNWITIDWIGWKLVEWKLSDPGSVGEWIGNGIMEGPLYRIDSFQLTHEEGAAMSGTLYFKDLRAIRKTYDIVGRIDDAEAIPQSYNLGQNYPNPFNARTTIEYSIAVPGYTELSVFDILGKHVLTLVGKNSSAGRYKVAFDAGQLATGVYIYQLKSGNTYLRKKMMLVK